jgi:transposase InsO family protein
MAFGLTNAPATFERLMETILAGLHWVTCLVYLDDIIVFADSFQLEIERLGEVIERLHQAGLKLHPGKCHFFQHEVKYLGHIVSGKGIATDPDKTKVLETWPQPMNVKEVRSFLGTCSYYRRFIPHFADIAAPLHKLTCKGVGFVWTEECTSAFNRLKQALVSPPILAYPSPDGNYILDTDASNFAISGILSQLQHGEEKVIAYYSQALSKEERRYCVTRRELLAVVKSVKHFHYYLYGVDFQVRTDHGSLAWLLNFKNPEDQLARWLELLGMYKMHIKHRPGRLHGNADGLSRIPCGPCPSCTRKEAKDRVGEVNHFACRMGRQVPLPSTPSTSQVDPNSAPVTALAPVSLIQGLSTLELQAAQEEAPDISELLLLLKNQQPRPSWNEISAKSLVFKRYWREWDRLVVKDGLLLREWHEVSSIKHQLIVPPKLQSTVLQGVHDAITAGHFGVRRTTLRLQSRYYWAGYQQDVKDWCRKCVACQARKTPAKPARAPMRPTRVGDRFQRVAMDILGPLPESEKGNRYIVVISDYFSKWVEAVPTTNMEAATIADVFVNTFVTRFGVPHQLHTDQGRQFESDLFQQICRLLDIDKTRTSPYWPQSDGLVERYNSNVEAMLSKVVSSHQRDWDKCLQPAMMAYRSSIHESTGFSPNMLMFGTELNLPIHLIIGLQPGDAEVNLGQYALSLRNRLTEVHELARDKLQLAGDTQKRQYDNKIKLHKYEVGDRVWLRHTKRTTGLSPKLGPKWVGPYRIDKVISDCLYCLRKPACRERRQVVHHNRLKPYEGSNAVVATQLNDPVQQLPPPGEEEEVLPEEADSSSDEEELPVESAAVTARGRAVRRPGYLHDFVC